MTHFPGRILPKQSRKTESKRPTREEIDDQVAKFLQQGGVIQQLHPETTQNTGLAEIGSQIDLNIQGLNEEARLNLDNFSK
ncbi:MAG: hypothetical protein HN867_15670 [Deltaproteobacteria bacterium]|nr:hypothetical protein [Deltaproteobacteria bacterium]MBT6727527.1 hypothetical protein [Deltaproteobacteria bacterium]MBT7204899.1 hypothetical protein [Deltaproteobacteria bacterium]|tara:strand:+ start:266 stop:508 length:243 start_codon:yes stop_codon:yes gene_type:complete